MDSFRHVICLNLIWIILMSTTYKNEPSFAEGLLLQAYKSLPQGYTFEEVATDDAVSNDKNNNYLSMATGSWSAISNPMETWNTGL